MKRFFPRNVIERFNAETLIKIEGKRKTGRPKLRWGVKIEEDLRETGWIREEAILVWHMGLYEKGTLQRNFCEKVQAIFKKK